MAFWILLPQNSAEPKPPDWSDVLRPKGTWEERTDQATDWYEAHCDYWYPAFIVIEKPEVWPSGKSLAGAMSGNLLKLVMFVGGLRQVTRRIACLEAEIVLVAPGEWKGQLKKPALKKRIERALGKPYREHERDAVGMGLAVQGWIDRVL